ncbi:MAG: protein kinase [Ignavibacteriales bacterium]|nr:protein kinase [Ignavibacteriales bacterium]
MGIVYKAQDTNLDRIVALKFLPSGARLEGPDRERFIQEAKTAAALNHPNICTIYGIESDGDQQFIAMEYIDGGTLREKLPFSRRSDALSVAVQIGEALQEAHAKGIVHRDIKAENIMLTSKGQVKVMDFGLAKLKGSLKLTRSSSTVGTLAYMAPEQIQGGAVDSRSDIFSFGVVLFEMLAGTTPFRGEHEAAMMYSILNEQAESLQKYVPDAESELLHVINRSLEKDPEDRYQHVQEMTIDLKRLKKESSKISRAAMALSKPQQPSAAEPSPADDDKPSGTREPQAKHKTTSVTLNIPTFEKKTLLRWLIPIGALAAGIIGYMSFFSSGESEAGERIPVAVADFHNQTKEEELDGLSGMLITSLEQSRRLSVLTRSRMFDFLKQMGKQDVDRIDESLGREICRRANVGALVVASIRKFDQLYIIDMKVLDPEKNEYLLTVKQEAEGKSSIPGMIDKLAEQTRIGLKERVSEVQASQRDVAEMTTPNIDAYQAYFRGEELINKLQFQEAADEFRKAVAIDSVFALAHYRLAYALSWYSVPGADKAIAKAMQYISRVPEKESYLIRGEDAIVRKEPELGLSIYKELLTLYPEDKEVNYLVGDYSFHQGDYSTAETALRKVISMDPLFSRAYQHLCWTLREIKKPDDLKSVAARYVEQIPSPDSYFHLSDSYLQVAEFDSALSVVDRGLNLFPHNGTLINFRGVIFLSRHSFEKAKAEFTKLSLDTKSPANRARGFSGLSTLAIARGQYREALNLIEAEVDVWRKGTNRTRLAGALAEKATVRYKILGQPQTTQKDLAEAMQYEKDADLYFYISLFEYYVAAGEFQKARDVVNSDLRVITQGFGVLVEAIAQYDAGNYGSAIALLSQENLTHESMYTLAKSYVATGQPDSALRTLEELRLLYHPNFVRFRAMYDAKSYYLTGTIYEKMGDRKKAFQSYTKLLDLWKNADNDIPELLDAKKRLALLR